MVGRVVRRFGDVVSDVAAAAASSLSSSSSSLKREEVGVGEERYHHHHHHNKARVTVRMNVNWSVVITGGAHGEFEIGLPIGDLGITAAAGGAEGERRRRRMDDCIEEKLKRFIVVGSGDVHSHQGCLLENLRTCRKKFHDLFDLLSY